MPPRVDPQLREAMAKGVARVDAIVVADDLELLKAALPKSVTIRREFGLIRAIAVTAPAESLREVSMLPGVRSIEPDREVSTQ